jgi:hypothetical protein
MRPPFSAQTVVAEDQGETVGRQVNDTRLSRQRVFQKWP